jgi:hypothetical protein
MLNIAQVGGALTVGIGIGSGLEATAYASFCGR